MHVHKPQAWHFDTDDAPPPRVVRDRDSVAPVQPRVQRFEVAHAHEPSAGEIMPNSRDGDSRDVVLKSEEADGRRRDISCADGSTTLC